jgi:uncharacterized protein (TIGR00369 family)
LQQRITNYSDIDKNVGPSVWKWLYLLHLRLRSIIDMKELRDNQRCYVCGKKNPIGLAVDFEIDADVRSIHARFTPLNDHQGYENIVHGGILSALLDEAMAKLAFSIGIPVVTAEMTVKFKAPATPGEELTISGKLTQETKRLILSEAKIERGPVVIAEATGKLLRIS